MTLIRYPIVFIEWYPMSTYVTIWAPCDCDDPKPHVDIWSYAEVDPEEMIRLYVCVSL